MHYDVFNGDADGIFALHQLRLSQPKSDAALVTGVKRDICLLRKVEPGGATSVTVLDVSLDKNRDDLERLLADDSKVLYIDHHFAGDIPDSELLEHHIEPSAETCTSLIVNHLLDESYPLWAACGAFGDNLHEQASSLAASAGATEPQIEILQEIGELFNYNGYGAKIEDLHYHPADLLRAVSAFSDPLSFYQETDFVSQLRAGYEKDMSRALSYKNISSLETTRVYSFPAESWARRIAGVFSNLKARERNYAAHAIIVENDDASLQVSVRAPLDDKKNADSLCRRFPTGGGRAAAAGINKLPPEMLEEFTEAFHSMYSNN